MNIFINNKYKKWYHMLIENAKERILEEGYFENHHIIPKSLGGNTDKDNLVRLTAREHFICHILLTKMTEGKEKAKMIYAARMMSIVRNEHHKRYINSRLYETIKKEYNKQLIGHEHWGPFTQTEEANRKRSEKLKGRTFSKETLRKISESQKGRIISLDTKKKMSEAKKGKPLTKEHKLKLSEARKSEKNHFYGRKHSLESKEKMRKAALNMSDETKKKMSEACKGRIISQATKKKISETLKKLPRTECCGKLFDPGNLIKHRKSSRCVMNKNSNRN